MVKEITTKVSKSHKERIMVSYTTGSYWTAIISCYCCCRYF